MRRPGRPPPVWLQVAAAAALGIGLAAVAHFFFFTGALAWLNLILWAAIGVAAGAVARSRASALTVTATTGFAIVFGYSVMGYQALAPLTHAIPLFAALSLLGAVAMAVTGITGHTIARIKQAHPRRA